MKQDGSERGGEAETREYRISFDDIMTNVDFEYLWKMSELWISSIILTCVINTNDESWRSVRYRYGTKKQLIMIGGLLITGIVTIVTLGTFVHRPTWRVPDSSVSSKKDGILVPPDPEFPQPPSWSKLRRFKRGAVCADGAPCAQIGKYVHSIAISSKNSNFPFFYLSFVPDRSMLDRNGSAVDAALAAMICNGLINMQGMGIGGGFLMTLYERSTRQEYFLNAREAAPIRSRHDMYENEPEMASRIGKHRKIYSSYKISTTMKMKKQRNRATRISSKLQRNFMLIKTI